MPISTDPAAGTRVLVVDQEPASAASLERALQALGATVHVAPTLPAMRARFDQEPPHVVVVSLRTIRASELVELMADCPEAAWIAASQGLGEEERAAVLHAGADIVRLPIDPGELRFAWERAVALGRHRGGLPVRPSGGAAAPVVASRAMREVLAVAARAAETASTVLLRGETGTGKEVVARAIHASSPRRDHPFVKVDCTAFPEALLESELFGYERGAFTGALERKPGRVELAAGGTLFLDEIAEIPPRLQAKLLRLLQDREIERLGGTATHSVDVRVIAATHRDLEAMIERGEFRQDLLYRLNVVPIWLPPLRARRDDIEVLARHFTDVAARRLGRESKELTAEAVRLLRAERWPGNARQLQNLIERMVVLAESPSLGAAEVRSALARESGASFVTEPVSTGADPTSPLDRDIRAAERVALVRALREAKGNRTLAARLLGVSRSTLYEKLTEHGLS